MTPIRPDRDAQPLDARRHQHLRLDERQAGLSPSQVRQHLVPLALPEVPQAALDYPLVFVSRQGRLLLCAVVGLNEGDNLFVDEHGHWEAERWLPVQLSQGPFTLQAVPSGQPVAPVPAELAAGSAFATDPAPGPTPAALVLHLDHPQLSTQRGAPLYLPGGHECGHLADVRALQADYQAGVRAATALAGRLHRLGLLQHSRLPYAAEQAGCSVDGELTQVWLVNEHRLAALDAAQLHRLMACGDLALVQALQLSLNQLPRLAHRLLRRAAAARPQPNPQHLSAGVLHMPPRRRASDLHPVSRAPLPPAGSLPLHAAQA